MPGFKPSVKPGKPGAGHGAAPPKLSGGHWATIHGHPVYLKGGAVHFGGAPGVTHDHHGKPLHAPDVDHAAMARKVAEGAAEARRSYHAADFRYEYEHGPPRSAADVAHLAKATAAGKVAVHITGGPDRHVVGNEHAAAHLDASEPAFTHHPGAVHHIVGGTLVATQHRVGDVHHVISHQVYTDKAAGKVIRDETGVTRHATAEKADARAGRLVQDFAAGRDTSVRISTHAPESLDFASLGQYSPHHTTKFRVIRPDGGTASGFRPK